MKAFICIIFHLTYLASVHADEFLTVKNVTFLGAQLSPDVNDISRDGGYSALINGNSVWLYDDSECLDAEGTQLSFISNTAAYVLDPSNKVNSVTDFGVVRVGSEHDGTPKKAILADTTVGTGGWIPFLPDELEFNQQMNGKQRVAIWPGTSPTSISTTQAFVLAPLVYVDMKPQDPSKEYQGRGMTLITINAPSSGPVAVRQGDLVIPGTEIGHGGFASLLGRKTTASGADGDDNRRDVYLLGVAKSGLQLARVDLNDLNLFDRYSFWHPQNLTFTDRSPDRDLTDKIETYMPGTFSSGSIFFSPYYETFIMVYFDKMVDSTFYIRHLDLQRPLSQDRVWTAGGKNARGIEAEDVEALIRYVWSDEQVLYVSIPDRGGFNYAGTAHPEFFNRQHFAKSLYPVGTSAHRRLNDWYGGTVVSESQAGSDGKHLLLSWTSQAGAGIYRVELAVVEFADRSAASTSTSLSFNGPSRTTQGVIRQSRTGDVHDAVTSIFHYLDHGQSSGQPCFLRWIWPKLVTLIVLVMIV